MNPFFLLPMAPAITSSSAAVTGFPASNVLLDEPALSYRINSASSGNIIFDFGAAVSLDTVAVLGGNLRAADTVRVRAGTTSGNTSSSPTYDSTALAAWTGSKTGARSKTVQAFTAHSARYWRLDFGASTHPDGYIEASRILFGLRVEATVPLPPRAAPYLLDPSLIEEGDGWESVDERDGLNGWRVPFEWITDADWFSTWWPFLQRAKLSKRALFVPFPDEPARLQDTAVYGRIRSFENAHPFHDGFQCEIQIVSNGL